MSLTSRITVRGRDPKFDASDDTEPEDILAGSIGVIFPDDVVNMHGDAEHSLAYTSPHLPRPLFLRLCDPKADQERRLFSHHLWNASLLLAELIEADTLGLPLAGRTARPLLIDSASTPVSFDVSGLATIELGSGTALPSLMAALIGAARVAVTDYPAKEVIATLRRNVAGNVVADASPLGRVARTEVQGHIWGVFDAPAEEGREPAASQTSPPSSISPSSATAAAETASTAGEIADGIPPGSGARHDESEHLLGTDNDDDDVDGEAWEPGRWHDNGFALRHEHSFDRVFVSDCLWMPWQHDALRESVAWFLRDDPSARAWVVTGLHTARQAMRGFFDREALAHEGLEVESIWERDCDGVEREWEWDRGPEDVSGRKRWLIVAVLRRVASEGGDGDAGKVEAVLIDLGDDLDDEREGA